MELVHALVGDATGNELFTLDCLRDGDELWMIPSWYVAQDGRSRTPAIAIRVNEAAPQPSAFAGHQLLLQPISKAVLTGATDTHAGETYEVLRDELAEARFGWLPVRVTS